jgi:hypothetical protein
MEVSSFVRTVMIGLTLVSGLVTSLPAQAQPVDQAQEAQDLFVLGREKVKSGNCLDAIPLFEASIKAHTSRGASYNLALCEEETGRLTSAWTHFKELLPQLDDSDERQPDTKQRIAALEQRIARIRPALAAGTPAGAIVTLDGTELHAAQLGTDIAVDPGQHVVTVKVAGREDRRHDIPAAAGQQQDLTLEVGAPIVQPRPPGPRESTTTPSGTPPPPPASRLLAPGLVAGGVGLAGLGVMTVTGILAIGKKGELEQECPPQTDRCTGAGMAMAREGKALTTTSTVAAAIGLVGIGAGVTLLVWPRRGSNTATLGPVVSASGGGVVLGGRF